MKIELISIGDELLKGLTLNTNVTFLSAELSQRGYLISRQTTLVDDPEGLQSGLVEAIERADVVIATGGLGPTLDDHTKQVAARLFFSKLYYNPVVARDLEARFGKTLASLQDQATVPEKATLLKNSVGTAPGLIFRKEKKALILLPGVPLEMKPMFIEQVVPYLEQEYPTQEQKKTRRLFFCLLVENTLDPHLRQLKIDYPSVEIGIYPAWGTVSVTLTSSDFGALYHCEEEIKKKFHTYLYHSPSGKIEEAVQSWFIENHKTLGLAESCTGGMIASQLTAIPGASAYFLGSFVTYCDQLKQTLLGVSKKSLDAKGAVSQEVVAEMLAGIFSRTNADWGIAVSGVAGPGGGTLKKPIGTVWAAIGERGSLPFIGTFIAKGNRSTKILSTSQLLLGILYRKIVWEVPPFSS